MKKQPEITERTRQNLIDAFWLLYCEKRIDKITIKEITDKAGYNRGTFYEYFSDVYDVLEQIENSLLPGNIDEMPPRTIPSPELSFPVNAFVKMYEEHSKYYVVLLGDNGDPSFQSKMKNRLKPLLLQVLGGTKGIEDFRIDYTIEYMLSAMIGVLSYWFRQEKRPPIHELINLMYDIVTNDRILKIFDFAGKN